MTPSRSWAVSDLITHDYSRLNLYLTAHLSLGFLVVPVNVISGL